MTPSPATDDPAQEPLPAAAAVAHRGLAGWELPLAVLTYGVAALAANWPAFPGDPALFRQGDLTQAAWFIAWTPAALLHHQNPFYTTFLNYPRGIDLLRNTLAPLLGLLTTPLTLTAGPAASVNLLLWASFPLSAGAMYALARRFVRSPLAGWVAGAIYGFSPYMVGQGAVHLNLMFVPLPPLILLTLVGVLEGRRRSGWILGALVVAQFFVNPEVLATTAIVATLTLGTSALMCPGRALPILRRSLPPVGRAALVAVLCLSYPVWVMIAGPFHYDGPVFAGGLSADLLGPIVPTSSQLLDPGGWARVGDLLVRANIPENGSYLGPALCVLLVALLVRYWRSWRLRLCAAMIGVCFVLSLGPQLTVDGVNTGVALPFALLEHLPLLDNILTVRIALYVDLYVALMVALAMDTMLADLSGHIPARPNRSRVGLWAWLGFVATVAILCVAEWLPHWPYPSAPTGVPAYFRASAVRRIPEGTVALVSPYPSVEEVQPMLWRASAAMRFRILGGYGWFRGDHGASSDFPAVLAPMPVERFLWWGVTGGAVYPAGPVPQFGPKLIRRLRTFLARNQVGAVLWTPVGAEPTVTRRLFVAALGPPSQVTGGVDAWYDVQATLKRQRQ